MTVAPTIDGRVRVTGEPTPLADGLVVDDRLALAIAFAYEGPATFRAGELSRWTLRFTAAVELPGDACVAVAHRWPNDWGVAQGSDPAGVDFLVARTSDGCAVRWWASRLHTWHPFDHALFVELPDGLPRGAHVELRYGDDAQGSPGFRVQTFIEEASPFSLRWQARPNARWVEFARHVARVVGSEPAKLVLTAPSRVAAGEAFDLHLRVEDRWGNPAALDEPVHLRHADGQPVRIAGGWARVPLSLASPGVHRIHGRSAGERVLEAVSNPVEVVAARPAERLFWGDLHGQSVIGCGARSIDAYFAHARDFAATDVASHQANCFLVSSAEWAETQASTLRQRRPGFVTLLGVEWSGASSVGGDHNVYFPGDEAPLHRCSHEFLADRSDADSDLPHVEDLYRHYRGSDTLVAVHVGGRTADLNWHAPELDRLLEVHSTHATSEWFLFDALRRGHRMGVIAGSDGVDGRPGNSHPGHMGVRNVRGGLTAIVAAELTREAIWDALKRRRCYATTGERIVLEFSAGDARMGEDVRWTDVPPFDVRVEGTAPIETIDLFRDTERIDGVDLLAEGERSPRVRVAWRGASAPGNWQRARMDWNGGLRVDGATIAAADGWAFDTPDEGIAWHDASSVRWTSITAGDWDGVVVTLDAVTPSAELSFVTAPMSVRCRLASLGHGVRAFAAHHPERMVELRRLPDRMPPLTFRGRLTDPAPRPGAHAYWVRVRQADGGCAWSSPIFADCG